MRLALKIRKGHRLLGLAFGLSILLSAGSGVLHQVMARTQAPPPAVKPAGPALAVDKIKVSVPQAARTAGVQGQTQAVSIRSIQGQPWYQFVLQGSAKPAYVNAETGEVGADEDFRYASQIASAFLGGAEVRQTDYLTGFNSEYLNIFRILPVYRFDAADSRGTRLYVSTMTGSVTRHTDNQRQFEANVFTYIHKFGFIPNRDLRDAVLIFMTAGAFLSALAGMALFFITRSNKSIKEIL